MGRDTERAARIVAERGVCYVRKSNKYEVQIRSHNLTELDLIQHTLGGGIYNQPSARRPTWIWRAGNKEDLLRIAKEVLPHWSREGNSSLVPLFELYDGLFSQEAQEQVDKEHSG